MTELTERQREVLKFIQAYIASHGYSPSTRDIAEHFAVQINATRHHLQALRKKGYITWEQKMARSITLTEQARPLRGIPIINLSDITEA